MIDLSKACRLAQKKCHFKYLEYVFETPNWYIISVLTHDGWEPGWTPYFVSKKNGQIKSYPLLDNRIHNPADDEDWMPLDVPEQYRFPGEFITLENGTTRKNPYYDGNKSE